MKKIFILSILSIALFGCNKKSGFEIIGKFENAKGRIVHLDKLLADRVEKVDSITINDDGNFIFDGELHEPAFFMLSLSKNEFIYLLLDSCDKITITADAKDIQKTYALKGSEGSLLLKEMHNHLLSSLEQIDSLGLIYRQYYNTSQLDSVTKILNENSSRILTGEKEFLLLFIQRNSNSLASYLALFQQLSPRDFILKAEEDISVFSFVDSCLNKTYPRSGYIKKLSSIVAQVKGRLKEIEASEALLKPGKIAPDITMITQEGSEKSLSSLHGKYVLLDFWASWCPDCRKENPNLVKTYQKFKSKGFEIFQVSLDKTKDSWQIAITKDKLTWVHVSDLKYWDSPVVKLFALKEIPTNFLLDKNGKIIAKNLMGDTLDAKLKEILK